ncbi:GGDEF domain-containing protein [Sphingobium xanthum]|uniref:GGDEF domain-containing protein n=1 Tax=Sphingobium xanthum TaxID=1387165 RepID=UPI001C8C6E55|nr:GGDEF domain-containing protein [Sphingobium xanthum]
MKHRPTSNRTQPEAVEIEMIRSLFLAFIPSSVMTAGFIAAGIAIYERTQDAILLGLLITGAIASSARLAVAWRLAVKAADPRLSLAEATRLERRFAVPYLAFAVILGLFGARAFSIPAPDVHMLTICLLVGYCAGVAVGMGLRLRIAVPAMALATVPACLAALLTFTPVYVVMSALVAALLIGGTHNLKQRHELAARTIAMRFAFATLAREDALTALPNRIALREWYEDRLAGDDDSLIAVHYIDLNGFKPVNDSYGHPVGDELLTAVGKRIVNTIRDRDIAARLGGDEFVVIQCGLTTGTQAEMLASRLSDAISRPFRIGDRTIEISAGLGFVVAHPADAEDLEHLLNLADQALYASKRAGEVQQYNAVEPIERRSAA